MSPASYLTAPPRVAASMIAPHGSGRRRRYDGRRAASDLDFAVFLRRRARRLQRLRRRPRPSHVAGGAGALGRRGGGARPRLAGRGRGGGARGRALRRERAARGRRRAPPAFTRTAHAPPRRGDAGARDARPAPRAPAEMTRVAAIDLGTNATRLLVADVEDGHVGEVLRRTRITRLGEGVD